MKHLWSKKTSLTVNLKTDSYKSPRIASLGAYTTRGIKNGRIVTGRISSCFEFGSFMSFLFYCLVLRQIHNEEQREEFQGSTEVFLFINAQKRSSTLSPRYSSSFGLRYSSKSVILVTFSDNTLPPHIGQFSSDERNCRNSSIMAGW